MNKKTLKKFVDDFNKKWQTNVIGIFWVTVVAIVIFLILPRTLKIVVFAFLLVWGLPSIVNWIWDKRIAEKNKTRKDAATKAAKKLKEKIDAGASKIIYKYKAVDGTKKEHTMREKCPTMEDIIFLQKMNQNQ